MSKERLEIGADGMVTSVGGSVDEGVKFGRDGRIGGRKERVAGFKEGEVVLGYDDSGSLCDSACVFGFFRRLIVVYEDIAKDDENSARSNFQHSLKPYITHHNELSSNYRSDVNQLRTFAQNTRGWQL